MVYFLVYYKSMLIFEREMDHSLEDLPEHGLEVLHDLGVHQAAPLLDDGLRHVVSLQEAGVSLKSNCLLIESVKKGKFSASDLTIVDTCVDAETKLEDESEAKMAETHRKTNLQP